MSLDQRPPAQKKTSELRLTSTAEKRIFILDKTIWNHVFHRRIIRSGVFIDIPIKRPTAVIPFRFSRTSCRDDSHICDHFLTRFRHDFVNAIRYEMFQIKERHAFCRNHEVLIRQSFIPFCQLCIWSNNPWKTCAENEALHCRQRRKRRLASLFIDFVGIQAMLHGFDSICEDAREWLRTLLILELTRRCYAPNIKHHNSLVKSFFESEKQENGINSAIDQCCVLREQ